MTQRKLGVGATCCGGSCEICVEHTVVPEALEFDFDEVYEEEDQ